MSFTQIILVRCEYHIGERAAFALASSEVNQTEWVMEIASPGLTLQSRCLYSPRFYCVYQHNKNRSGKPVKCRIRIKKALLFMNTFSYFFYKLISLVSKRNVIVTIGTGTSIKNVYYFIIQQVSQRYEVNSNDVITYFKFLSTYVKILRMRTLYTYM